MKVAEQKVDPYALEASATPDLGFAAERTAERAEDPRGLRQTFKGLVGEISSRTKPLSARLRGWQKGHIRQVAGKLNLGFVVVFLLLMLWPDVKQVSRFLSGFQGSGYQEETRLWELIDEPEPIPEAEVFAEYPKNKRDLMARPLHADTQFLWDSCLKEADKGVCHRPVPEKVI